VLVVVMYLKIKGNQSREYPIQMRNISKHSMEIAKEEAN